MHYLSTVMTVPPQCIHAVLRPWLLQHDADCICKSDGIVGGIGRQEEHLPFANGYIPMLSIVDDFQEHRALVLVEPFGSGIDVIVCAGIWAANDLNGQFSEANRAALSDGDSYHDGHIFVIDAVVVDWRFEQMEVLLQPV